jgi:hypothetical protein
MNKIGDWFIGLLYVMVVFLFVRPGTQGPALVTATLTGVDNLATTATGGGTWASK